jgi:hypothetical protein
MTAWGAAAWPLKGISAAILVASVAAAAVTATRDSASAQAPSGVTFGPTPPSDIAAPAGPQQAAVFAWQEFIALTWPARPNPAPGSSGYFRGQPDLTAFSGSTGPNGLTVWETYYHRTELYPAYPFSSGNANVLPDPNAPPTYLYGTAPTKATPTTSLTLFNNMDESSEIGLALMYHTPLAQKVDALQAMYPNPTPAQQAQIEAAGIAAGLVYEAKGNGVIFNYLKSTLFNNNLPRRAARVQTIGLITNDPKAKGPYFLLPNGAIEIKATWRHYNEGIDDLSKFHWRQGIYYTPGATPDAPPVANNGKLLLVGLHIIQKTPTFQTFTFATFEHVSNEASGFRFTNTNPQTCKVNACNGVPVPRPLPDPGVIAAQRRYPLPPALVALNTAVQNQLRSQFGQDNVWANYKLIGVQSAVQDDPGGAVPPQQFFLSNFATESNNTLQFFQGGLGGPMANIPNPAMASVYKRDGSGGYRAYAAGGCVGCHGAAAQAAGSDFSVIAKNGNTNLPIEPAVPYPGGTVTPQNFTGFPLVHQAQAVPSRNRASPSKRRGN